MVRWIAALVLVAGCMGHSRSNRDEEDAAVDEQDKLPQAAAFDAKRSMEYLKAICAIGPRISGTEGMRKQQELMKKHFEKLGLEVRMQTFQGKQRSKAEIEMSNMIVSFEPKKTKRVILCSHYDTRPIADQEEDPRDWRKPFISANDGGSGVALLMELAHHLKDLKIEVGVDFVFFDGEEYIWNNKDEDEGGDQYFIGSKYFAQAWVKNKRQPEYQGAILLDMIAGKDPEFPQDFYSRRNAKKLCDEVWSLARKLKIRSFKDQDGPKVRDDHLPLQEAGMSAIDIIDFTNYGHWHKLSDTPENCTGESMRKVATLLSVWIQQVR